MNARRVGIIVGLAVGLLVTILAFRGPRRPPDGGGRDSPGDAGRRSPAARDAALGGRPAADVTPLPEPKTLPERVKAMRGCAEKPPKCDDELLRRLKDEIMFLTREQIAELVRQLDSDGLALLLGLLRERFLIEPTLAGWFGQEFAELVAGLYAEGLEVALLVYMHNGACQLRTPEFSAAMYRALLAAPDEHSRAWARNVLPSVADERTLKKIVDRMGEVKTVFDIYECGYIVRCLDDDRPERKDLLLEMDQRFLRRGVDLAMESIERHGTDIEYALRATTYTTYRPISEIVTDYLLPGSYSDQVRQRVLEFIQRSDPCLWDAARWSRAAEEYRTTAIGSSVAQVARRLTDPTSDPAYHLQEK